MSGNLTVRPKFITAYEKLLSSSAGQLASFDQDQFWSDVFTLDVDKAWLYEKLQDLSHEDCLGRYKPLLNLIFRRSLTHFSNAEYGDPRKRNCLETLILFVLVGLSKQMSGWEVMDVFAGGVGASDTLFSDFTRIIDDILGDEDAPTELRHRTLQLALTYACGVNQLSPGAYFLRRDLYPSLASVIISPKMQRFTFEATLLLSILSNFHKSDAAKTNPYLNRIKESADEEIMKRISWVIAFATEKTSNAYQEISDDSPPTLATTFGSLMSSLRPDRALSSTPIDPPRELFKNQPIEAAVVLLPFHDFLHYNQTFKRLFIASLTPPPDKTIQGPVKPPLPHVFLSLSSYLVTHASSTSAPRALAYAHLTLTTLLICVEDRDVMNALCQSSDAFAEVRLCRQRQPYLPFSSSPRPPICALLDCCVLWLRHNLHKRLDVLSYLICIRILHRAIWFATVERLRLKYHWEELWRSLLLLLDFVTNQIGSLKSVSKVDELVTEVICLLDFCTRFGEIFLPTPQSLHQLVYELVRSAPVFTKQSELLNSLKSPANKRQSGSPLVAAELASLQRITGYYEEKLIENKVQTAGAVMRLITKEVDQEGVFGVEEQNVEDLPKYSDDAADYAFARWACMDGLALMQG